MALSTDDADWYDNLVNSINHVLAGFFSVKKITTDIKPFMSEQQRWLVKEQLKFLYSVHKPPHYKNNGRCLWMLSTMP